jgi:hypothetical protein
MGVLRGDTRLDAADIQVPLRRIRQSKNNSSAALRLEKVGHCNDLDGIAACAPQFRVPAGDFLDSIGAHQADLS